MSLLSIGATASLPVGVMLLATPTGVTTIIPVGAIGRATGDRPARQFTSATVFVTTVASIRTLVVQVAVLQYCVLV